jgi:Pyridoxamine 5'-phosphate oxidase
MLKAAPWPEPVDEILDGDHVAMLAYVTPAKGVVLTPVNNFGVRDREGGTVTPNSSVGAWRKLDRMRRNPRVALAFHTREHARHRRPEYVLVQGTASLSEPHPDYPDTILEHWERFEEGWRDLGPVWRWWLRVYRWRVGIEIAVQRLVVWPDLACRGTPQVHGPPLPVQAPAPQRPPAGGTGPRLNHSRAARRAAALPHVLLGWVGGDGLPMVVPVAVGPSEPSGIVLRAPEEVVPPGGRRAGLTAHRFSRNVVGQHQRVHTGWLEAGDGPGGLVYAPHTEASYRFPASKPLFRLIAGGATRWRLRRARSAGLWPPQFGQANFVEGRSWRTPST